MSYATRHLHTMTLHSLLKQGRSVNAGSLSRSCDISHRSAQRLIEDLRDRLLAPVVYDHHRRTYFYADITFELPAALMTADEAVAVVIAFQALKEQAGMPLKEHLDSAMAKLRTSMPGAITVEVPEILNGLSFAPRPGRTVAGRVLDTLMRAAHAHRAVRVQYWAAHSDETTARVLDPYLLTCRRGDWYAVGFCHLREEIRTFAVSRVRSVALLSEHFNVSAEFDASHYFDTAFGIGRAAACHVVLAFGAYEGRFIRERRWHPSQRLEEAGDGGVRLHLDVGVDVELRQWILSFGRHVQVVEPTSLAAEIAAEHAAAAGAYGHS